MLLTLILISIIAFLSRLIFRRKDDGGPEGEG